MINECYERAQKLMHGVFTKNIALNTTVFPNWIDRSDSFWYIREMQSGKEYRLVNAKDCSNDIAFDHAALADALGRLVDQRVDANNLPIDKVSIKLAPMVVHFEAFAKSWVYHVDSGLCSPLEGAAESSIVSPCGRYGIFLRDYNVWLRDLNSGDERALTSDGEGDYVYGVGTLCMMPFDLFPMQVRWSPDSKSIFLVQRDSRQVKTSPVIYHVPQDGTIRPQLVETQEALPGDANIETLRLVVIDIETAQLQAANYRSIPITRSALPFFDAGLGWWSADSRRAYFVDMERDYKTVRLVEFDVGSGATKILFEETSNSFIGLMHNSDEPPTLIPLPDTGELIWFSERSGWAHLYLYDLESGQLKNSITQGDWLVRDVIMVDAQRREVFVQTAGREENKDPYYRDLCRINIDTGEIITLASSDHEYCVVTQKSQNTMIAIGSGLDVSSSAGLAPSGNFAVVTRSRADQAPVTLLVDRDANEMLTVERADVSKLPENWQWPEPVKLLAADGQTDIYGLVFRPSNFSPDNTYPIVSHVYNVPDLTWVSKGSFTNGVSFGLPYLDAAAIAELGFIVVQTDGRGTPYRDKAFFEHCYGWTEDASTIADHVAGIQQLAERYPYMDLSRVGISSHCCGGMGVVNSLCLHDGFYQVGVAAMAYDSRFMPAPLWGDRYEGLSDHSGDHQYPEQNVNRLQGKLLIMNTMVDGLAPVEGTLRIVEALQEANKDFDMVLLPNSSGGYLIRCAWDYLVEHLLGVTPPEDFLVETFLD